MGFEIYKKRYTSRAVGGTGAIYPFYVLVASIAYPWSSSWLIFSVCIAALIYLFSCNSLLNVFFKHYKFLTIFTVIYSAIFIVTPIILIQTNEPISLNTIELMCLGFWFVMLYVYGRYFNSAEVLDKAGWVDVT